MAVCKGQNWGTPTNFGRSNWHFVARDSPNSSWRKQHYPYWGQIFWHGTTLPLIASTGCSPGHPLPEESRSVSDCSNSTNKHDKSSFGAFDKFPYDPQTPWLTEPIFTSLPPEKSFGNYESKDLWTGLARTNSVRWLTTSDLLIVWPWPWVGWPLQPTNTTRDC